MIIPDCSHIAMTTTVDVIKEKKENWQFCIKTWREDRRHTLMAAAHGLVSMTTIKGIIGGFFKKFYYQNLKRGEMIRKMVEKRE